MNSIFKTHLRDFSCSEITSKLIGKKVCSVGWVKKVRNHGGIIFLDIRDRTGVVQAVIDSNSETLYELASKIKKEFVVQVCGVVRKRPENQINKNMKTGEVEILAEKLLILNESEETPIEVKDDAVITEKNRFKYRYLDLRRPKIQKNIVFRHKVSSAVREFLNSKGFLDIETPMLVKSTPEGARDFLVPSRLHKGKFYALPQSPQLYKQLLMVSGFDRYYQIVKCLRDEDLRADRQPEFTQIDLEMSFVSEEDVMNITEEMIKYVVEKVLGVKIKESFERITYDEAMNLYGSDKPDLRFGLKLRDVKAEVLKLGLKIFENAESIKAILVNAVFSRKKIKEFESIVKLFKAKGLAWLSIKDSQTFGSLSKFADEKFVDDIGLKDGQTIFIVAGSKKVVNTSLGQLRLKLGEELNLINKDELKFLWVVDFPMFEYDEEEKRLVAQHHPFTKPKDVELLDKDPLSVKALAYDIVLNGWELGGGSIRIENINLQKKIFKLIGLSDEDADKKFGFLLNALRFGAPPHGGLAIGLDRFVTLLSKQTDIREFIAFPKNKSAESPMDGSPSEVDPKQLEELGIRLDK